MLNNNKKINVEFLPTKPADNQIENDFLITQLMITAAKIGIRGLSKDNCAIMESEVNDVESS